MALAVLAACRPSPDAGSAAAGAGFDLSTCLVDRELIVASGMPRDGLHVLDQPPMLQATAVGELNREGRGKFLVPADRVVGVALGGAARAYPLRLLRWHEVVNDVVGGIPIAVTYNPLCDSVAVFDRRAGGDTLRFGVSGFLYNSNMLLYDRSPSDDRPPSLFSQLQARAVAGPAAARGIVLPVLPAALTTWETWRAAHPSTLILAPDERLKRLYRRDPYHSYFGSDLLRFPVEPLPPRGAGLRLKDRIVAVSVNGVEEVFALPHLAAAAGGGDGSVVTSVGAVRLRIDFQVDPGVASVRLLDQVPPHRLGVRHAFWFAWYASHPHLRARFSGTQMGRV